MYLPPPGRFFLFRFARVSEVEYAKAEEDEAALNDDGPEVGGLNDKDIYNLLEGSGDN